MCSLLIVSRALGKGTAGDWVLTDDKGLHPHIVV